MKTQMKYQIDENLKNDFDEFILNKYETKHSKYSIELGKAMKLQLALAGNEKYMDDPDVINFRDVFAEKYSSTHTRKGEDKIEVRNEDQETNLEEEVQDLKNELKEMKALLTTAISQNKHERENQQYRENPPTTANTLTNKPLTKDQLIIDNFNTKYGDYNQVSKNDLTELIMNTGLTNRQTINNKITYLKSKGLITPVNPNVPNVFNVVLNGK
jgi:hypothetical protein